VLARTQIPWILACLWLAGCATGSRQSAYHEAGWQDLEARPITPHPFVKPALPLVSSNTVAVVSNPPPAAKPTSTPGPLETWVPLQRWTRNAGFASPLRSPAPPQLTYTLRSTNGAFVLSAGSQFARWNGIDLRLGFAPQLIDNQIYVHRLDLVKTVQPLLAGASRLNLGAAPVLVIDPGHGGENAGARSVLPGHYEKEYTLDWAWRLRNLMQAKGWQVYLTRSNDTDLALSNRVAFAADHKAALFLSLHFNSAGEETVESGLETYCLTPVGMPSSLTRGFADEIFQTFPNNAYDTQNLLLAFAVHRSLLEVNGRQDRGVRRARFPGVLRGQERPSILIEGGYISNPREARLIADAAYRQKLAEGVARGLEDYANVPAPGGAQYSVRIPQTPAKISQSSGPGESGGE
jgi:N-acetylmuramoyl-L-alanine amidase